MRFIEKWLRRVISEELAKINSSLQAEKDAVRSLIAVLDEQRRAYADVVEPHVEVSRLTKENLELREAFKSIPPLVDTISKLHPHS